MGNQMVGHLKREVASKLSPLIDASMIAVEGVMDAGNMNGPASTFTIPMYVSVDYYIFTRDSIIYS